MIYRSVPRSVLYEVRLMSFKRHRRISRRCFSSFIAADVFSFYAVIRQRPPTVLNKFRSIGEHRIIIRIYVAFGIRIRLNTFVGGVVHSAFEGANKGISGSAGLFCRTRNRAGVRLGCPCLGASTRTPHYPTPVPFRRRSPDRFFGAVI